VGDHSAGRAGGIRIQRRGATLQAQLQLSVVAEKHSAVESHTAVKQVSLESEFVSAKLLRVKRRRLVSEEGPRADAATLETGCILHICHRDWCEPVLRSDAVVEVVSIVVTGSAAEAGHPGGITLCDTGGAAVDGCRPVAVMR